MRSNLQRRMAYYTLEAVHLDQLQGYIHADQACNENRGCNDENNHDSNQDDRNRCGSSRSICNVVKRDTLDDHICLSRNHSHEHACNRSNRLGSSLALMC